MAHGQALRALISKSSLILVLAIILVLLIVSAIAADDYVDVPAEYYFGRWAQGQYGIAGGQFRSDDSPAWRYGYGYTTEGYRFAIDSLVAYGLWDSEHGRFQTARVSGWWLPTDQMQIGLTDLSYSRRHAESSVTATSPVAQSSRETSLNLTPNIWWLNRRELALTRDQALHSYLLGDFLDAGQAVVYSELSLGFNSRESNLQRYDAQSGIPPQVSVVTRSHSNRIALQGSLLWGIRSDLNLHLGLSIRDYARKSTSDHGMSYSDSAYLLESRDIWQRNDHLDYNLELRWLALPALWVHASAQQAFDYYEYEYGVDTYRSTSEFTSTVSKRTDRLNPTTNLFSFGFDYLTTGGFQPGLLVDDYQDYYGHLLSDRQILLSGEITYRREEAGYRGTSVSYLARSGWSGYFEAGVNGTYQFAELPSQQYLGQMYYQRALSADLQLRWRTYRYEPGKGPGWDRDSRYDILFGSIPRAGHWSGTIRTKIFRAYDNSTTRPGTFAFWDLDYDIRLDEYYLTQRLGLGRHIALQAVQDIVFTGESIGKLSIRSHYYSVGIVARPVEMVQLEVTLTDRYFSWHSNTPAEWNVTLRGLL